MNEFKPVKTAIVGCGTISTIYAKNLVHLFSMTELVAVCDHKQTTAKERAKQFSIAQVLTLDEICAHPEIELVVNLTGPAAHYSVIKQCLLAGKHVYTEKLLCLDVEQGKELCKLADEKGLYLGCAPDTFLGAGLQTARKVLDTGMIGSVTSVSAAINRNQALNSETFRFIRSKGGSFPYDVGVYYVAALLALLGPVTQVTGFAKDAPEHRGEYIHVGNYGKTWTLPGSNLQTASLRFASGVLGTLHFDGTSINDEQPAITIYGTEGILKLGDPNGFNGSCTLIRMETGVCNIPFTHGYAGCPLYGEPTPFDWGGHRGLGACELAWSLRTGRKSPRASKEMALHTLELLTGIDKASEEGRVYDLQTTFDKPAPLPSGYLSTQGGGRIRADAEYSLTV